MTKLKLNNMNINEEFSYDVSGEWYTVNVPIHLTSD